MRRRPAGRWAAVALVLASVGLFGAGTAPAATPPPASGARIFLTSQNTWITPGEDLTLGLRIDPAGGSSTDFAVAATVCPRVLTRSEFALTLQDNKIQCPPRTFVGPLAVSALQTATDGSSTLEIPLADLSREPGVYPVKVELRPSPNPKGQIIDHFVTEMVVVGAPTTNLKLGVALVLPIDANPRVTLAGATSRLQIDQAASDRVSGLTSEIATHPAVPLTLRPSALTLDALAASDRATDAASLQSLVAEAGSTATRQLIGEPYAPIDVAAMTAAGLENEVTAQLARGDDELEQTLHARPDPRTWVSDAPMGQQAIAAVSDRGVDRVLLPEASLVPVQHDLTATRPFTIEAEPGRRLAAIAPDSGLAADFAPTDDPVLAAQRLLADLAVIYFDAPGSLTARVVVAAPPRSWSSDAAFTHAVLDGLQTSPLAAGVTVDDAFPAATVTGKGRSSPLLRKVAATTVAVDSLPAEKIRSTRHRLDGFGTLLDRDNQQASDLFDDLDRSLLLSESSDLRARARDTAVATVDRRIDAQLKLVHLSNTSSIRLTARSGEIPVTVISDAPYPLHLVLQIQSDKLRFPHGAVKTVDITRRNTTSTFTVEARTSGVFGLKVSMESPASGLLVGQRHVTVRSTAASDVGLILSIGAGVFLLVWWGRNFRHGRRAKRLVAA